LKAKLSMEQQAALRRLGREGIMHVFEADGRVTHALARRNLVELRQFDGNVRRPHWTLTELGESVAAAVSFEEGRTRETF